MIPLQVHEYALVLLALWGYGTKVADMIDCGVVVVTSDEALEVMALCKGRQQRQPNYHHNYHHHHIYP